MAERLADLAVRYGEPGGQVGPPTPEDHYEKLSRRIGEVLREELASKPGMVDLMGGWAGAKEMMHDIPGTFVIGGHGMTNHPGLASEGNPLGRRGLLPDMRQTNELNRLLDERQSMWWQTDPISRAGAETSGGLALGEIAAAMGPGTNDVETLINLACYQAGIPPSEAWKLFPKLKRYIASDPDSSTSSMYSVPMFQEEQDPFFRDNPYPPGDQSPGVPYSSVGTNYLMQNYQPGSTNAIRRRSDWNTNEYPAAAGFGPVEYKTNKFSVGVEPPPLMLRPIRR